MDGNAKLIGIDFGTLSARAVVVSSADGAILGSAVCPYPHGVITGALPDGTPLPDDYALAHSGDYRDALFSSVRQAVEKSGIAPEEVAGIGVDATTFTMVTVDADDVPLCEDPAYASEPMAWIKLWKHHGGEAEAVKIREVNDAMGPLTFVKRSGWMVNSEWALPKLLETYDKAPEVFRAADHFYDLGDWLVYLLTGTRTANYAGLGFKGAWAPDVGAPEDQVLEALGGSEFAKGLKEKFYIEPTGYDKAAGFLTEEAAQKMGLKAGVPVSAAVGDGTAPVIAMGVNYPEGVAITIGTSIAMAFLSEKLSELPGINGVAKDGAVPGYWIYDAGQPCVGDMLEWFTKYQAPPASHAAAEAEGKNLHQYFSDLAAANAPWEQKLTVLDWWNGNRSILGDSALRGAVIGYSMDTRPEDIYGAMVQGFACGSRRVVDFIAEGGIRFDRIFLCGGISEKNRFVAEQYANIFGREVEIVGSKPLTVLSSAILAAVAAGDTFKDAARRLVPRDFTKVSPDMAHRDQYEALYQRWCRYHDMLGGTRK